MRQNIFRIKDNKKFSCCNKLISRGIKGSSSFLYSINGIGKIKPTMVNCSEYIATDVVGVSVNGSRKGRISFDKDEVFNASLVGVTFVTDNIEDTEREYNVGERELQEYIALRGYNRVSEFEWKRN